MYLKVIFVLASVFIACSSSTIVNSCTDSKGLFPNVTYSINSYVCESSPCDCVLNCPAVISIDFEAPRYLEKIKPHAHASCMGVELDYNLGQDDACDGITNTQCPIVKDEKVNYKYELNIPPIFPEVTVTLRFSIVDEELNEDVLCYTWDIAVKRSECPP